MKCIPSIFWLLLAIPLILSNCITTEQLRAKHGYQSQSDKLNACIGLTKKQLIMEWGIPAKEAPDNDGGEILIYVASVFGSSWNYRLFYLNEQGKVYHWLTQTKYVPPDRIDIHIFNN